MAQVLEVAERFLRLAWSWPLSQGRWRTAVGRVLPWFFLTTMLTPLMCIAAGMGDSMMDSVDLLADGVASCLCLVKMRCMHRNTATLLEVRRLLETVFAPMETTVQPAARQANARCVRRTARWARVFVYTYSVLSAIGLVILASAVASGDPADRRLTTAVPDVALRTDLLFWPLYLGVIVEFFLFPIATGVFDALFLSLCLHIACKCDILRLLLGKAGRETGDDQDTRDIATARPGHPSERLWSPLSPSRSGHLKDCIRYHQLIIKLYQLTEDMFSNVTLFQMTYILVGIGVPLMRISNGIFSEDFSKTTFMIFYTVWNMCQLLAYCWFGDKVARTSSSVGVAAYAVFEPRFSSTGERLAMPGPVQFSMPTDSEKEGFFLRFMIMRAQKPLHLTAGRFSKLTLSFCLDIMRRSYSLYSALLRVRSTPSLAAAA